MIHANHAKEITDKFDPIADLHVRLSAAKSEVSEKILHAARCGRYGVDVDLDNDLMADIVEYLTADCGYDVSPAQDPCCVRVSWA